MKTFSIFVNNTDKTFWVFVKKQGVNIFDFCYNRDINIFDIVTDIRAKCQIICMLLIIRLVQYISEE